MAAATPADCSPLTAAATCAPTRLGSAPYEREPITKLPGGPITSASGAKSTLMPTAASSCPAPFQAASVSSGRPAAPNAIALGSCTRPDLIRVTQPYSWSVPSSSSTCSAAAPPMLGRAARSASVSARTWAAVPPAAVFSTSPIRITPPSR